MSCCQGGREALAPPLSAEEIKGAVRSQYAASAERVRSLGEAGGCGCGCGASDRLGGLAPGLYDQAETALLPERAVLASLGCGSPTAVAELAEGEVVLDLGSGGGIDVLLSALKVGPEGRAYGLDMTPEMLELAKENQREAGADNAEFLHGDMEDVPLPDASVDVVISNCVINLAADKRRVFSEAFRVLRPGGRLAVSDLVFQGDVSPAVRTDLELWAGCVAGALEESEFRRLLEEAGFVDVEIEPLQAYGPWNPAALLEPAGEVSEGVGAAPAGGARLVSASVRGRKRGG